jgi:hypothetical protein
MPVLGNVCEAVMDPLSVLCDFRFAFHIGMRYILDRERLRLLHRLCNGHDESIDLIVGNKCGYSACAE